MITLYTDKEKLIELLESHIQYLEASGYDNDPKSPYYYHPDIDYCHELLNQLQ